MLRVYPILREQLCAELKKADKNFDDARLSLDCPLDGVHAAYYAGECASAIVGGIDHGKYEKIAAQNGYVNVTFSSSDLFGFLPAFIESLPSTMTSYSISEDEFFSPIRYAAMRLLMFSKIAGNSCEDSSEVLSSKKDCPVFLGNLGYFPQDPQVRDSLFRLYSLAEPLPNSKLANRAKSVSAQLLALFDFDSTNRVQRLTELQPLAIAGAKALFAVNALLQLNVEEGDS